MELARAYELMTRDIVTVPMDARLVHAISALSRGNISSVVVTDSQAPVGILTERDIARIASSSADIHKLSVSDCISPNLITVDRNANIVTVIAVMHRNGIRRVVVTEAGGKLSGIITYSDILRKLDAEFFKVQKTIGEVMTKEILTVPPEAVLRTTMEKMVEEKKSCVVVTSDGSLTGILTERDIVRLLARDVSLDAEVKDICTRNVIYANQETLLFDALGLMNQHRIRRLAVLDDRLQLKGIVTQTDILALLHGNIVHDIEGRFERFKESLDQLRTGFIEFELNEEGTILWVNSHGSCELGFDSVGDAVGASFAGLLRERSQWSDFLKSSQGQEGFETRTFHLRDRVIDGSFRLRKFAASGIFRDVTDWHREGERIKEERSRLDNILKTLSEGILIFDAEGKVKDVNDAASAMFEMERAEMIGKPYYSPRFSFIDENGVILREGNLLFPEVFQKGTEVRNVINGYRRRDGTVLWFKASSRPVRGSSGALQETVTVVTDITELYNLEKRNQRIIETAREGYWEVDLDGRITRINKALSNLLGYGVDELSGKSIYDLVDAENRIIFKQALQRRGEGISESYEIALRHKNGSGIFVIVSASPQMDSSHKVTHAFAFLSDITALKATHTILDTIASFSKDITRTLTETEAIDVLRHYLLSLRKGESRINALYFVRVDQSMHFTEDVISYNDSGLPEVSKFPGPDKCKAFVYSGAFVINDLSKEYACPYHRLAAKSGSYYCTTIQVGSATSSVVHLYSSSSDFFKEQIKEAIDSFIALFAPSVTNMRLIELNKKLALVDPLTGLYNRRYFEAFMEKQLAISKRNSQPLSVIMLDLDDFKYLNDTKGHEVGDAALKVVASVMNRSIRLSDIAVRYGGEEFIIALPNTDKVTAREVTERIRATIETTPIVVGRDERAFVTASFGVAAYEVDASNLDELIAKADSALYRAKKAGKNRAFTA